MKVSATVETAVLVLRLFMVIGAGPSVRVVFIIRAIKLSAGVRSEKIVID